ncbi:hypothetical protein BDF22DRAFT_740882 [Syncephalis plumigaleata]|nr:hypothetical protein BDF22DRAFT_740882 [Syncephalis plumigaleata]
MSAESDKRSRIIEPNAHSTGMFVNVRPGPEGYRQRQRHHRHSQKTTDHNLSDESDDAWTEEERELLSNVRENMERKQRSYTAGATASNMEDYLNQHGYGSDTMENNHMTTGQAGQIPILLAILPAGWGDAVTLLAVGWVLYYVTQIPWDIYEGARLQAQVNLLRKRGRKHLEQLRHREHVALAVTFVAPLASALLLQQTRSYLTALQRVPSGSILLYVLVASVRPMFHVVDMLRRRAARLRRELSWSPHEADRIRLQLADVEDQVAELRLLVIREDDMQAVKNEMLNNVERAVRRVKTMARHEEHERIQVAERVAVVEERVNSAEDWLEQQRVQQAQQNLLVRCVFEPVEVIKEVVQLKRGVTAVEDSSTTTTTAAAAATTNRVNVIGDNDNDNYHEH